MDVDLHRFLRLRPQILSIVELFQFDFDEYVVADIVAMECEYRLGSVRLRRRLDKLRRTAMTPLLILLNLFYINLILCYNNLEKKNSVSVMQSMSHLFLLNESLVRHYLPMFAND